MTPKPSLSLAALTACLLLLLTGAYAFSQRIATAEVPWPHPGHSVAVPAVNGRCAINHARFGGQRAQMYKVTRDGVANYVVMEVGSRRDPLMRFIRNDWLRMAYGEGAERVWLGSFGSSDAALAKAAQLCPPPLRCLPGDADCAVEPRHATPTEIFSGQ